MGKANAYSIFVHDVARRRRESGEGCIVANLFKELGPVWSNLPDREKQKYKDRAKSSTSLPSNDQWTKCKETPVDDLAIELKPSVSKIKVEIKTESKKRPYEDIKCPTDQIQDKKKLKPGIPNWKNIKNSGIVEDPIKYLHQNLYDLREQCESILRVRADKVVTIPIYSFSVNVLCKQKKEKEEIFVPLEISICAYSVKTGYIGNPYHVLIDAGTVPKGCYNIAVEHSEYHKITFPPKNHGYPVGARNDYKKIYKEMLDYTKEGERTILIGSSRDLAQVRRSLEWLYKKGMEEPGTKLAKVSTWTILPVREFIATMHNCVFQSMLKNEVPLFGLYYVIDILLDSSVLDFNSAIMCGYHAKPENETKWCAQSCAKRMFMYLEAPVFNKILKLYEVYRKSMKPASEQIMNNFPRIAEPHDHRNLGHTMQPLQSVEDVQLLKDTHQQHQQQPVLALTGATTPDMNISISKDPRLISGRLTPAESPVPIITDGDSIWVDDDSPPKKAFKKKEDPLIIASTGKIYEYPPDIF